MDAEHLECTWQRKGSRDGIGGGGGGDDDDDDDGIGVKEGKKAWTFPEIHWKLLKAFGSERNMIRFAL